MKSFKLKLFIALAVFLVVSGAVFSPALAVTLSIGSSGDAVTRLQQALVQNGYYIKVDGKYGSETADAVRMYQSAQGLKIDGMAGPETLKDIGLADLAGSGSGTAAGGDSGSGSQSMGCPQGWEPLAGGTCAPPSPVKGGLFETKTVGQLITNVLKILLGLAGMIAVVLIVWGGFQYMTSGGNSEAAEKGRTTLINAIIGLVIVMVAWLVIQIITNLLYKGSAF